MTLLRHHLAQAWPKWHDHKNKPDNNSRGEAATTTRPDQHDMTHATAQPACRGDPAHDGGDGDQAAGDDDSGAAGGRGGGRGRSDGTGRDACLGDMSDLLEWLSTTTVISITTTVIIVVTA